MPQLDLTNEEYLILAAIFNVGYYTLMAESENQERAIQIFLLAGGFTNQHPNVVSLTKKIRTNFPPPSIHHLQLIKSDAEKSPLP